MLSKFFRFLAISFCIFMTLGFRTFTSQKTFAITNASTAAAKVFVDYDQASATLVNDLPSSDPLAGSSSITVASVMNSVFTDYNSIAEAYVQLVDTSDSDYATQSTNRVITIRQASTGGLSGGEAQLQFSGNVYTGCQIDVKPDLYNKASVFIAAITHEIGHCLGLDHPQDTVNAVMSYFNQNISRLQIDDKMGIVYLYPVDPDKAKEQATFGMSCARTK
jgi:Matrixin